MVINDMYVRLTIFSLAGLLAMLDSIIYKSLIGALIFVLCGIVYSMALTKDSTKNNKNDN